MEYYDLEQLNPEDYLNPENFKTQFDDQPATSQNYSAEEFAKKRYEDGLKIGQEHNEILINDRSVWSAIKEGSILSSSEGIGFHRNTKELLQGFIDSGVTIKVARFQNGEFSNTVICGEELPKQTQRNRARLR